MWRTYFLITCLMITAIVICESYSTKTYAQTSRPGYPACLLIGEWEAQIPGNNYRLRVDWDGGDSKFKGYITKLGVASQNVGFAVGEFTYEASPPNDQGVMNDLGKYRYGSGGVSTGFFWASGTTNPANWVSVNEGVFYTNILHYRVDNQLDPTCTSSDVEVKLRAFIPCGAVDYYDPLDTFQDNVFGGDGRSFGYDNGTSRLEQVVTVSTDPLREPRVSAKKDWTVTTTRYSENDATFLELPFLQRQWCKGLKPGAVAERRTQTVPDMATVSREGTAVKVNISVDLGNPFGASLYANTNANLNVFIRGNDTNGPQYKITGSHDGFPAYELYINKKLVYCHDPLASGDSPRSLFDDGVGEYDIEVDSGDWRNVTAIDCKPIFGVRVNSPIGQKESFFTFTGNAFPPNTNISITAGDKYIGTVTSDGTGRFQVILRSDTASIGRYKINFSTTDQNLASLFTATTQFNIEQNTIFLDKPEGIANIFDIPNGANEKEILYLPLVVK